MAETVIYDPASQHAGDNGLLPYALMANGGFGGFGNNAWPLLFAMNGGGFGGFGGWGGAGLGGGVLGFILGALVGNGNLFGGGMGSGSGAAGFLSNQINGDNGRELIMNAIQGTDADVRLLATTLNADVNEVRSAISVLNNGLTALAGQLGLSGQQIINSIQAGNASLAHQLCECCCNMRQQVMEQGYQNQIATLNQTNQLGNAITGNGQRIVDSIADLKTTTVKEFCDARERDMQNEINSKNEIISTLKGQIDNANQTSQILASVNALVAPIAAKVTEIEGKIPNTVPVQWPQLTAVNTTPYVSGGIYGSGLGFGGGFVNF